MEEIAKTEETLKKYKKVRLKDIPNLRFGVLHSQVGFADGVSIVMDQIEKTMCKRRKVPEANFRYLVGKSKHKKENITAREILWHKHPINNKILRLFEKGYTPKFKGKIEEAIEIAKCEIRDWIKREKVEVIIAHNTAHPVNFIMSVALSRYYRETILNGDETPKYILWWHDSHLERARFSNPSPGIKNYLLEGVPGPYPEYIVFINSTQYGIAERYFQIIDKIRPGYFDDIFERYDVIYNTTNTFVKSYEEVEKKERALHENFLDYFNMKEILSERIELNDIQFVLQHTRVVPRKRIDFALKYCFELNKGLKKEKSKKAVVLFISGHSGDELGNYKRKLINLHKKLAKQYKTDRVHLIFAEDYESDINFEEFPLIMAELGGISTFFSEVEGFGNNLLEVLANGLIPLVYTYPVFKSDIENKGFKVVSVSDFEVTKESVDETLSLIRSPQKRRNWVNQNLTVLKKFFSHKIISRKLARAIIRKRIKN